MPNGDNEPVRLIGIDAPEDGSTLDIEATAYLETLVLGEEVLMVADISDRDTFGRLLRYLYVGEVFVNEEMVLAGLAIAKRYEPDTSMAEQLEAAQLVAQGAALGLFSDILASSTTVATTAIASTASTSSTTIQTTTTAATTNCDPAYPDFCIPSPPPDLDCGDIGSNDFTVLPPDPHAFDGNADGVGCES
jgi:micrococcal nuclease